jgi:NAD(P)-dependent dehydrogenase (short-subunit alcohol dehydrogenase family)
MRLANKVALITGAAIGMGAAAAQRFAAEGAAVSVVDIDLEGAAATAQRIVGAGGQALACRADVSAEADVKAAVDATISRFGKLDIVYNNAGIDIENAPTGEYSIERFDQIIAVNLRGVFLGMRFAIPHMAGRGGSIINTSSVVAFKAMRGGVAYCASKAAVIAMTKVAAMLAEARRRMPPGTLEESMKSVPLGRTGTVEEIANLALFLASDESSYITGAAFPIEGGSLA